MQLYLDTANLDAIKKALEYGVISGVTTNPTSIAKEGAQIIPRIAEILKLSITLDVSAQVVATDAFGMGEQGKQ